MAIWDSFTSIPVFFPVEQLHGGNIDKIGKDRRRQYINRVMNMLDKKEESCQHRSTQRQTFVLLFFKT